MNIKLCSYCHTKSHTYSIYHAYLYWYRYSVICKWLYNVPFPESRSSQMWTFICSGQQPWVPSEECKSNSKPKTPCTKTSAKCTTCRLHLTSQGVKETSQGLEATSRGGSVLSIPNKSLFLIAYVPQVLLWGSQIQINIFTVYRIVSVFQINIFTNSDKHIFS